ncbi:eukaryotic translation initiation factor 2A, partial [Nothobranchius furzeri]
PAVSVSVRGSEGTSLLSGPPRCEPHPAFQRDTHPSRCLTFSTDGTLFGWCNGRSVHVVKCIDGSTVSNFELPKTALIEFSPLNNILVTWQPYTKTQDSPQGEANLRLWELPSGRPIKSLYQKKVDSWCPIWSEDEKICVRSVNNELHFYENNDFNSIANKLHMQKVSDFALSPGTQPSKVAVYVPGSKGAPSFVRLYQYPALEGPSAALANKSFFKADRVSMHWNRKGESPERLQKPGFPKANLWVVPSASAVLVTASTEVDKSGASYYGEQTLHYLAVNGETAVVQLAKNGPIYDVVWSPNSSEFCVVYGFMPAKATVFNLKCEPIFDFGTGPRNAAYYSPQGHILVLAGFGNLQGQMEVWDVRKYKQSPLTPLDVTRLPMIENAPYSKSGGAEQPQSSSHHRKDRDRNRDRDRDLDRDQEQDQDLPYTHTITSSGRSSAPPLPSSFFKSTSSTHGGHGYPRSQSACPSPVNMGRSLTPLSLKRPPPYDTLIAGGGMPRSSSSSSTSSQRAGEGGATLNSSSSAHGSMYNVSVRSQTPTSPVDELNSSSTSGKQVTKRRSSGRKNKDGEGKSTLNPILKGHY